MSDLAERAPDDQERTLAAVSHFAIIGVFWLIVPIGIYFWKRESSKFVAFHALQAALLAVFAIPLWIGSMLIAALFGLGAALVLGLEGPAVAVETILVGAAVCLAGGVTLLLAILGGLKALRGEAWSMPLLGKLAARVIASGAA